jgi:hypothetical protein
MTQLDYATRKPNSPYRLLHDLAPVESRSQRWTGVVVALLIAAIYAFILFSYWAPAHVGNNENGYLVGGKQFAHTLSTGFKPVHPLEFVGKMWVYHADTQTNYPKYPIGLPLIVAGVMTVFGADQGEFGTVAAWAISPAMATVAVFGMFLLTRLLGGTFAGLAAMLLLAFGQVFFTLAVRPNSHAAAVCVIVWGTFFLLRFMQTASLWRGALAGFMIGYACMIRYTDGLLGLGVGLACLSMVRLTHPLAALKLLVPILFWAIPITAQVAFTWFSMGALTSYDSTNESAGFGWHYAFYPDGTGNWNTMASVLNDSGLFLVAAMGLLGTVWLASQSPRVAILLLSWCIPSIALYAAYYYGQNVAVQYSRFVMSAMPALIVAAAWAMSELVRRVQIDADAPRTRRAQAGMTLACGAIVAIASSVGVARSLGMTPATANGSGYGNVAVGAVEYRNLAELGKLSAKYVPAGSMVFTCEDDRLTHYLQFVGQWQLFSFDWFDQRRTQALFRRLSQDKDDPDPFDPARITMLREFYEGKNQDALRQLMADLLKGAHAKGQRVFYILDTDRARRLDRIAQQNGMTVRQVMISDDLSPDVDAPPTEEKEAEEELLKKHARLRPQVMNNVGAAGAGKWVIAEIVPTSPPPTTRPVKR